MNSIASPLVWGLFLIAMCLILIIDIVGSGQAHKMSVKSALTWTGIWVGLALLFALGLWGYLKNTVGPMIAQEKTIEFLTGYVIEKSLSLDNVFVFLMIFNHFKVPLAYQRKVLLYGIFSAIILRLVMILMGVWLVEQFSWILYVFGAFLVITGLKIFKTTDKASDLNTNIVLRCMKAYLPLVDSFRGDRFSIIEKGKRFFTPLMLVLILIELSDIVFAVDSIPAIFAITTDPFIVFTSNIFAIMGLRALYFLLADMAERFHFLKYGLAIILIFVGIKMLIVPWVHIPTILSLVVIGSIILGTTVISMVYAKKSNK